MKKMSLLLSLCAALMAENYYAKVEPVSTLSIKSNVSGQIVYANEVMEGSRANDEVLVRIDAQSDLNELRLTKEKLQYQLELVELNKRIFTKKNDYFNAINTLRSKSELEKDNAYYAQANAQIQYLSSRSQYDELQQRRFVLEKSIADKKIVLPRLFIKKLYVKAGDFVNMGSTIVDADDVSKAKVTFFISKEDALLFKEQIITVDGEKIDASLVKVWNVSDSEHVSLYKAEIILPAPKLFSKLVSIDFTTVGEK